MVSRPRGLTMRVLLRPLDSSEHVQKRAPLVPLHLLPLLRPREKQRDNRVGCEFLLCQPLEAWVCSDPLGHPRPEFFHVCNGVHHASNSESVGVLSQKTLLDDSPPMVRRLEVGIGEQEEELLELALVEKVGQVLHRIGTNAADVLVPPRMLATERDAPFLHVLTHLVSDFHA